MRAAKIVILVLIIPIFLIPISVADVTPNPIWPPSHLLQRDAAHNLTTWFANTLNAQIDEARTGEWFQIDRLEIPEGLGAVDSYLLPLVDGGVQARYLASGLLMDIVLEGKTSHVAISDDDDDLKTVTYHIASDLGLNTSQAQFLKQIAIWDTEMPQDESLLIVGLMEQTTLGSPYNFNTLSIGFHQPDMRVVYVYATVWYQTAGDPALYNEDAFILISDYAQTEFNASDLTGSSDVVAVWNGTQYAYLVHVQYDVGSGSLYTLDGWVDANTGEVLWKEGPQIIILDKGVPFGNEVWAVMAIFAVSLVVALAVFYRINSERALDHFTRGRIFGYLQANPGANYTMIRESLRLSNGTAAYHLWVLERLGFVKSVSKGRMKQFYPQGVSLSKGSLILTRLQYSILDLLEAEGALSQSDIARSLEMSRQRAHYNVKVLRSLDLIERTDDGLEKLSWKGEETIAEGENGLFVSPSSEPDISTEAN